MSEFYSGRTVWIKSGDRKGQQAKVYQGRPHNKIEVRFGFADYAVYDTDELSLEDPAKNDLPLPPNFLPNTFSVGDRVVVKNSRTHALNGVEGTVVAVPTAAATWGNDRMYKIKLTKLTGKTSHVLGQNVYFYPDSLQAAPPLEYREGDEIPHEAVQIGDTILVAYTTEGGGIQQTSTKQGTVAKITRDNFNKKMCFYARSDNGSTVGLSYGIDGEKITLIKKAPNPYVEILKGLKAGSVVAWEKETGRHYTFVKSCDGFGALTKDNWHEINNNISASSSKVTEDAVVKALSNGAEIVHKVR
jgi:hypothetical protein